jgi:hypothetical protein
LDVSDARNRSFNGAPPVPLALDEAATKLFATTTREAFVGVTGTYTDFLDNSTTIIKGTNTLGVAHNVPIPFTFGATTVLFFNRECEISKSVARATLVDKSTYSLLTMPTELIHAFATVPVELLGFPVDPPQLPPLVPFNPDPVGPPQDKK